MSVNADSAEKPNSVDHFYCQSDIIADKVGNGCHIKEPNTFFISLAPLSLKRSGRYSECLKTKLSPDYKSWWLETVTHPETATGASNNIWLNQLDNKSIALIKTGQSGKTAIPHQRPALTQTQIKGLSDVALMPSDHSVTGRADLLLSQQWWKIWFSILNKHIKSHIVPIEKAVFALEDKSALKLTEMGLLNLFSS